VKILETTVAWARNDRSRRLTYFVLALVGAVLIFFPRPYLARARIVPEDTSASAASTTALIGALGGASQSLGSLLTGGRPSNDLYLIIGRSNSVTEDVIKSLNLVGPGREYRTIHDAKIDLEKHVDVHMLLGGVLEIETKLYDPDRALRLTSAYSSSISRQLAQFAQQLIDNKRKIVRRRFEEASDRIVKAEAEVNNYRRSNNLSEPEQQLGAALSQRAGLEAQLQAKEVQYRTLSQLRGPESSELLALQSDIAELRQQIARSTTPAAGVGGPNVAGLTSIQLRYLDLYRNLRFQQAMYDIYKRSAEQVEVEELAAESANYVQVIDPAHIDADRQFNIWAIGLFGGILLLALFTEWYAPATGLFGVRRKVVEQPSPVLAHE
jgi:hypothetical protein